VAEAAWKPWVAGLLVVGAIAMVGRNLASPLWQRVFATKSAPADTVSETPIESPAPREADGSIPAETSRLSDWAEECDRDPFVVHVRRRSSFETGDRPIVPSRSAPRKPPKPRVSAIAWGHDRMALVDGRTVRIGDSLPDGVLIEILPDRLALLGPEGDTILRFREGRTP